MDAQETVSDVNNSSTPTQTLRTLSREELYTTLIEKEYELECAQDQLQTLTVLHTECERKDGVIKELRRELAAYKHNSHSKDISYVSMEEHLSTCEDHLQMKTKKVEKLSQELKSSKEKISQAEAKIDMLSTSTCKLKSLQKELADKTTETHKQKEELQKLRTQRESDRESLASLRHRVTELQANLSSLQAKTQEVKSNNEDLKLKLQRSECERERLSVIEQRRKEELVKLKSTLSTGKLAQAKQDFLEAEVEKTKLKENELAAQLGKAREEVSALCQKIVSVVTQVLSVAGDTSSAVEVVQQLAREYMSTKEQLSGTRTQLDKVQAEHSMTNSTISSVSQLWTEFKSRINLSTSCEYTQSAVEALMTNLKSQHKHGSCKALINSLQEALSILNSAVLTKWAQLVAEIEDHCSKLELSTEGRAEPAIKLNLLREDLQSQREQCQQLKNKLGGIDEEHKRVLDTIRQEEEQKVANAVEERLTAEMKKFNSEMQLLEQRLTTEKLEVVAKEQRQTISLTQQLTSTKQSLLTECREKEVVMAEKAGLEAKLQLVEVSMQEAITTAEVAMETLRAQLTQEMIGYREQAHQHAVTIVALEERLLSSRDSCKQLTTQNEALAQMVCDASTGVKGQQKEEAGRIAKLMKLTDTLRHQLTLANDECTKSQTRVKQLESDLLKVRSQIKDREALISQQYQEQINDLKLTISKQENALEGRRVETAHLHSLLQEKAELAAAKEEERRDTENKLSEAMKQLDQVARCSDMGGCGLNELGQQCSGERHSETIANQRRALADLRAQLHELELTKPPVGSHQATLKELSRVRHELLKARAQLSNPSTPANLPHEPELTLPAVNIESKEEKVKLEQLQKSVSELQDILQCSEKTYKQLVDVICKNMIDIDRLSPQGIADVSEEERKDILKERKKFAEAVLRRFKTLSIRNGNKSESVSNTPGWEGLAEGTGCMEELQMALDSAKEELEQQRRLNQALIRRKIFKENQLAETLQRPHHKCIK